MVSKIYTCIQIKTIKDIDTSSNVWELFLNYI